MKKIICLFLLFFISLNFYSQEYKNNLKIKLEQDENSLIIEYINLSDNDIYVPEYYMCGEYYFDVLNNYFEIYDENNKKIKYTGIIGDFRFYKIYVKIEKGCSIKTMVNLEKYYKIQKNSKYEVRYNFSGIKSDSITFYYK